MKDDSNQDHDTYDLEPSEVTSSSSEPEPLEVAGAPVPESETDDAQGQLGEVATEASTGKGKKGRRKKEAADGAPAEPDQQKPRRGGRRKASATVTPPTDSRDASSPETPERSDTGGAADVTQGDLAKVLGLGSLLMASAVVLLTAIRIKSVAYLRPFTTACFSAPTHWVEGINGTPGDDILCIGDDCPLCEAGLPARTKYGAPAVNLNERRLGLLTWKAPARDGAVMLNSVQEALRSAIVAGLGQHVLLLQRVDKFTFRHRVQPIPPVQDGGAARGVDFGDDLIQRYEEAIDKGEVVIQLALRLTRREILDRYPQIAQAAALGGIFGAKLPSDQEDALAALLGTFDDKDPNKEGWKP